MSKNELATIDEAKTMQVLKSSLYPGAKDESIRMVVDYCRATGLDPIQKPVHIVPMYDSATGGYRDVVMPGIALYRTLAHRDGCAGISEPEFGPTIEREFPEESVYNKKTKSYDTLPGFTLKIPEWCKVTVKKIVAGQICEFSAIERWEENYATIRNNLTQPNAMWKKRVFGQLAKCAEAQALRKAHPEAVGNQPTAEEMEGKSIDMGTVEFSHEEPRPECNPVLLDQAEKEAEWGTANFKQFWENTLIKEQRQELRYELKRLQELAKRFDEHEAA